jgi:hypothetical protein
MSYRFDYFEDRPHVPIKIHYKGKYFRFLPLLDSGADFSVFNRADAYRIGLDWNKGKSLCLCNADGSEFRVKEFKLKVLVEHHPFTIPICFTESKKNAMPLLGRKSFFEKFEITFLENQERIVLRITD